MAQRSPFTWHVGEDLVITFTALAATAISGWHFSLVVCQDRMYSATGPYLFSSTNFTITDDVNGVFTFPIPNSGTTSIGRGQFWLQVRRTDNGLNTVLAEGPVTVNP